MVLVYLGMVGKYTIVLQQTKLEMGTMYMVIIGVENNTSKVFVMVSHYQIANSK